MRTILQMVVGAIKRGKYEQGLVMGRGEMFYIDWSGELSVRILRMN